MDSGTAKNYFWRQPSPKIGYYLAAPRTSFCAYSGKTRRAADLTEAYFQVNCALASVKAGAPRAVTRSSLNDEFAREGDRNTEANHGR